MSRGFSYALLLGSMTLVVMTAGASAVVTKNAISAEKSGKRMAVLFSANHS